MKKIELLDIIEHCVGKIWNKFYISEEKFYFEIYNYFDTQYLKHTLSIIWEEKLSMLENVGK